MALDGVANHGNKLFGKSDLIAGRKRIMIRT